MKNIFEFLTFEELNNSIRSVSKLLNGCFIMQKNNSIKLRAAFTHLFSKNIEFPKLAKIEIIFNKYCRQ